MTVYKVVGLEMGVSLQRNRKTSQSGFIETAAEVNHYLVNLHDQLLSAVNAGDRVRIK